MTPPKLFSKNWSGQVAFPIVIALCSFALPAAHAQVIRCIDPSGNVQYSNVGCPSSATRTQVNVRPNTVDMSGMREQNAIELAAAKRRRQHEELMVMQSGGLGASPSECPSDLEIRNMGVSATSKSLSKQGRDFQLAEVRRAESCRRGEGNYSASDWQVSKDAAAAQRSVRDDIRERERQRAEAMHSAANPAEGKRIQEERAAEAARVAARRQAAAAQAPRTLTSCDAGGCWDNLGARYSGTGPTLFTTTGRACRVVGTLVECDP